MTAPPPTSAAPRKRHPSDHIPTGRPRGRPAGKKRIDWGAIRDAYIQGSVGKDGVPEFESYSSLASRFGVGNGSIRVEGKKGDWPGKREEYQKALRAEIARKSIDNTATRIAEVGSQALETGSKILRTIDHMLVNPPPAGSVDPGYSAPTSDTVEIIQSLSVTFRNITHGARILTGAGPNPGDGRMGNGPGGANEAETLSPEAVRAADAAIGGATTTNRTPAPTTGAAPPGSGDD